MVERLAAIPMALAVNEADLRQLLAEVSFTRQFGFQLQSFADGECEPEAHPEEEHVGTFAEREVRA